MDEYLKRLNGLIRAITVGLTDESAKKFEGDVKKAKTFIEVLSAPTFTSENARKELQLKASEFCRDVLYNLHYFGKFHIPEIGSRWQHTNGNYYIVYDVTNDESERLEEEEYPIRISYRREMDGSKWSRNVAKWYQSYTEIHPVLTPLGGGTQQSQ